MNRRISDPDVRILAALSGTLEADYAQANDSWEGSPFAWIRAQSSRRRGKIGEQLVAGFLAAKNFDVASVKGTSADRLVNGHRVEIKTSTLWQNGIFKFQQIRDQDYEVLICLAICPFDAHCWAIPKDVLLKHVIGTMGQHTGRRGADTAWMSFAPQAPYAWLEPFGGRLRKAIKELARLAPR